MALVTSRQGGLSVAGRSLDLWKRGSKGLHAVGSFVLPRASSSGLALSCPGPQAVGQLCPAPFPLPVLPNEQGGLELRVFLPRPGSWGCLGHRTASRPRLLFSSTFSGGCLIFSIFHCFFLCCSHTGSWSFLPALPLVTNASAHTVPPVRLHFQVLGVVEVVVSNR